MPAVQAVASYLKYLVEIWTERIIRLYFRSSLILCYYIQIGHDRLIPCHFLFAVNNRPHRSRHITCVVDLTSGKMFQIASVSERCILNSNPPLYRVPFVMSLNMAAVIRYSGRCRFSMA